LSVSLCVFRAPLAGVCVKNCCDGVSGWLNGTWLALVRLITTDGKFLVLTLKFAKIDGMKIWHTSTQE
jgi:hypothetical protein